MSRLAELQHGDRGERFGSDILAGRQ